MSSTIRGGQSIDLNVQAGESLKVSTITGTYTATVLAGAGAGTALATESSGGGTYGPMSSAITIRIKSSADGIVSFAVGVSPVLDYYPAAQSFTDISGDVVGVLGAADVPYPTGTYLAFNDIGASISKQANVPYNFQYVDAVNGSDGNAGSYVAPKKTVAAASKAEGTALMLMRGQTHVIVASGSSPYLVASGQHVGAYGPSDVERPTAVHGGTSGSVFQFYNTVNGASVSDLIISLDGVANRKAVSGTMSATDTQNDIHVTRCKSIGGTATTYGSAFSISGPSIGVSSGQGYTKNVTFEDCVAEAAPSMGFGVYAATGVLENGEWNGVDFVNCKALNCGKDYDSHGFTAFSAGVVQGVIPSVSQWVNTAGNIYYIDVSAANIFNGTAWDVGVCNLDSSSTATYYFGRTANAVNAPGVYEYGFDSATQRLYVNFPSQNLATTPTKMWMCMSPTRGVRWINCLSEGQLYPNTTGIQEGHAFAFDDYVSNSAMLGCTATGAYGYGLSINKGNSNRVIGNIFTDNLLGSIGGTRANDTLVAKNIFRTANRGSAYAISLNSAFNGPAAYTARNRFVRNAFYNSLHGAAAVGIKGPAFSGWGQIAQANYYDGAMIPATGLVHTSGSLDSINSLIRSMNAFS